MAVVRIRNGGNAAFGKIVGIGMETAIDAENVGNVSAQDIQMHKNHFSSRVAAFKAAFPQTQNLDDEAIEEAIRAISENQDVKPDEVLRETKLGKYLTDGGMVGFATLAFNIAKFVCSG